MPRRDDGAPSGAAGWQQGIDVDLSCLDSLAATVDADVRDNVRLRASRLMGGYEYGVRFGHRGLSGEVASARAAYHECVCSAVSQLVGFVNGSTILARAAREVAAGYARADATAAATVAAGGSAPSRAADTAASEAATGALAHSIAVEAAVPSDILVDPPPGRYR